MFLAVTNRHHTWIPLSQFDVAAGETVDNLSIKIPLARVFTVRGRISGLDEILIKKATVAIYPKGQLTALDPVRKVPVDSEGGFAIEGVPAGEYLLRSFAPASPNSAGMRLVVQKTVQIRAEDLDSIVLTPPAPTRITGKFRFASDVAPSAEVLQLLLQPEPGANSAPRVQIQKDGSFTIDSLDPILYKMSLIGLAPPAYVYSAVLDEQPFDGPFLDLSSGGQHSLVIEVANGTAEIDAQLDQDASATTLAPQLLMFPAEPGLELFSPYQQTPDGQLKRSGVPPGDYIVFAADAFTLVQAPELWQEPEFVQAIRGDGVEVRLEKQDHKVISVSVLTNQRIERALQSTGRFHQ